MAVCRTRACPQEVLTLNAEEIKLISNQGETFQLEFLVGTMVPPGLPRFHLL